MKKVMLFIGIFFMSLIVQTKGFADFINITELVEKEILKSRKIIQR